MTLDENHNLIVVRPKSRRDVADMALKFREALGIAEGALYVDVMGILEFILPSELKDFDFCVLDEWYREEEAYYDARKNIIYIRADVYDKAAAGDGRARFTIMHEVSHYVLFKIWGVPYAMPLEDIANISDATLKSMDPEWQANTFTGAFLCKPDIIQNMSISEIETRCGVSNKAAEVAYSISRGISYSESRLDMEEFSRWSWQFAMSGSMSQFWEDIAQGGKVWRH